MSINRKFLYAGLFLAAIGVVLVAADVTSPDRSVLLDVLRLWPLALVAIGAALVLRRTRAGLTAGVLAALIPGLLLGSAFAAGPRFGAECVARDDGSGETTTEGATFVTAATVFLNTSCGRLNITTAPGSRWTLTARNTAGWVPVVSNESNGVSIESSQRYRDRFFGGSGFDAWDVTLPTSTLRVLSITANANAADVNLKDARIEAMGLTVNASSMTIDATEAAIAELNGVLNFGALSVILPASSNLTGSFAVSAGGLRVCAPPGLGLRVTARGVAGAIEVAGEHMSGSTWENPEYASAAHRADLEIRSNFSGVEINPIGGCR